MEERCLIGADSRCMTKRDAERLSACKGLGNHAGCPPECRGAGADAELESLVRLIDEDEDARLVSDRESGWRSETKSESRDACSELSQTTRCTDSSSRNA